MSTLRISDAPLLPDVDGTEKIPTGGRGDYAISVDQIKDHIFQDIGKELVGLGNVDNTSDLDKPVSTAQQAALNLKADKTYVDANLDLKADKTNVYTRSETTLALSTKADLVGGVIPSNQLPSYVDDVVEYTTDTLPIIGESGKIYVTTDTNRTWRWSGNQYVEISNGGVSDSTLKLQTPRKIANTDFDGTQDIDIRHNNLKDRDLVGSHPASAISYGDGSVASFLDSQGVLNTFNEEFKTNFITPEMFGAKANDPEFDNTSALNNAFATGKNIYSTPDKTYYVDGILNTKGQALVGGWKIHTSRYNLGTVATDVTQPDTSTIKMLYLETAYDLSELLFIKQLGFNIVNHYGYFSVSPADTNGTFSLLLDNAKTAGLLVNMGTENPQAQQDLSEFIHLYKDHHAVFGFSVFDEPGQRGFSLEAQQNKINTIRSLTGKYLSVVDSTGWDNPFKQKTNYDVDILFVNWYSHTQTGTLDERIEKDLQDMRYEYGFFKASSKLSRVVPTVGTFTYNNSLTTGTSFSEDINQVIGAADIFGRVGGGNFAMFVWDAVGDPAFILRVRNSPEFQQLAKRLCSQDVRKEYVTDAYLFGHSNADKDWGIDSILKEVSVLDKSTTDTNLNGNAYPIVLNYGATNTDRTSTGVNPIAFYSGIGFKGSSAGLATKIKTNKHVTAYLNHFNVAAVLSGVMRIYETPDNGYTNNAIASVDLVSADENIRVNAKSTSEHNTLLFHISSPSDTSIHYRRFLRGLVVTTDW